MTEQREAQHFEMDVALLRQQMEKLRQQLIERQLEEYPDSRIMTEDEVRDEWIDKFSPHVKQGIVNRCAEHSKRLKGLGFDDDVISSTFREDFSKAHREEREHVASCVLLAMSNSPVRVFYECSKRKDGTYKFRGCRYGVEGYQYMSGFSLHSL